MDATKTASAKRTAPSTVSHGARSGGVTQKDLARMAGVSLTTVYNAIHAKELVRPETRRRIYELMEQYDYQPNGIARAMVRGKTEVLGIIVPRIDVSYYAKLVSHIEPIVNATGYNCIICQHLDDMLKEEREIRLMRQRRVDGLIIRASGKREAAEPYRRLQRANIPFVLVDRRIPGLDEYFVGTDDAKACRDITEYLIRKGHRRIGMIGWRERSDTLGARFESYCRTLQEHGIPLDKRLIVECSEEYYGGRRETFELMSRFGADKPTAILTNNDTTVIGVLQAVTEMGLKVGKDIAVANIGGYVEGELASLLPFRLTCSVQPVATMAREAARMLREQIEGRSWHQGPILCPADVRIGDSA